MKNIFENALNYYGSNKFNLFAFIIGNNGGVYDTSRKYIDLYGWSGLYVHPIKEYFDSIKNSFGDSKYAKYNKYEMSHISDCDGLSTVHFFPTNTIKNSLIHETYYGIVSSSPPVSKQFFNDETRQYSKTITVDGMTIKSLFKKHNVKCVDFLSIEAQGKEFDILQQFDFKKYRPKIIRCDIQNISPLQRKHIKEFLTSKKYFIEYNDKYCDAIDLKIKNEVDRWSKNNIQENGTIMTTSNIISHYKNMTIVTGLFDLGRGRLNNSFNRSFDHYLECFSKLLKVDNPMVIFCDEQVEKFVWQHRNQKNTRVVRKTLNDIKNFPFYDNVQKIRKDEAWLSQAGWLRESTQATLELYNPLVMSKQFFLNDASILNFFDTKYFLWVDAGLANTVNLSQYFNSELEQRITPKMNKMLYLCFPYDGQTEVHGFTKSGMNRYSGKNTEYVARGGVFGGTKDVINEVNGIYYNLLNSTLNEGLMGTEESLFTIMTYTNPELFNIKMIDGNGLVYKFFEDIFKEKLTTVEDEGIAIYSLTFNLPKQYAAWIQSFKDVYPTEFKKFKKYVVNNSTDSTVSAEYQKLFKDNDITVIHSGSNVGINDGRQLIAEHFNKSNHKFYVFYEDDMLFHKKGSAICKSGFNTHIDGLFDKAASIVENENIDYLKLSFSEFYGDCSVNWAWFNVPKHKQDEYFPVRNDGVDRKKTKIDYIGIYKNVPYAIGEFHYCNWPIMMTKRGNRIVFLDIKYENLFEQTLMSQAMMHMRDGKLKVGCLLSSTINHNRIYHYDGKSRRENRHYKN